MTSLSQKMEEEEVKNTESRYENRLQVDPESSRQASLGPLDDLRSRFQGSRRASEGHKKAEGRQRRLRKGFKA